MSIRWKNCFEFTEERISRIKRFLTVLLLLAMFLRLFTYRYVLDCDRYPRHYGVMPLHQLALISTNQSRASSCYQYWMIQFTCIIYERYLQFIRLKSGHGHLGTRCRLIRSPLPTSNRVLLVSSGEVDGDSAVRATRSGSSRAAAARCHQCVLNGC